MTSSSQYNIISGKKDGQRIDSRIMEETIQEAVALGKRYLVVKAYGQHGIGGRLWRAGNEPVYIKIDGHPGQRVGAMGFANTFIEVMGPASDDVGWLNAGAQIVVHGNASNGVANAMAQGKIFIAGNVGARAMTMTKRNPRFDPPELWVLGSVGDYFGEFMAGGIAVICGYNPQRPDNVLGYRPLVGMVGGRVFFRGPHRGYSQADAIQVPIDDEQWTWLRQHLATFLEKINRSELLTELADRSQWQLLVARKPHQRTGTMRRSMTEFRRQVWDNILGPGGLVGDLTDIDRSPIPVITRGELRRFVPVWENNQYKAPCEAACPTGIPVHQRWRLVRDGCIDEAVDLALAYTPFPATVCGYLCPNLCMEACTKQEAALPPVDVTRLGKASVDAAVPRLPELSGKRIAVIGGGPAGISVAWQLRLKGHQAVVYDEAETLGGKIAAAIPESRLPADVFAKEIKRAAKVIPHVHLRQKLDRSQVEQLVEEYDFVVVAAGARKARTLPVPGKQYALTALDFLAAAKQGKAKVGRKVVVIGAGNVGCDAATEAFRLGASQVLLLDVQQPASFGKERQAAEALGAKFRWPVFTREITKSGVVLESGETIAADTVIISIGDMPDLDFLPEQVTVNQQGFIEVDENYQTTHPRIFAIGDVVRPGLLTDAIGAGRRAAETMVAILEGRRPDPDTRPMISKQRVHLEYYDPRMVNLDDLDGCAGQCSSCGSCRDCGICVTVCPEGAISRAEEKDGGYSYRVNDSKCIGCGFCAGACPCGVWNMVENTPIG